MKKNISSQPKELSAAMTDSGCVSLENLRGQIQTAALATELYTKPSDLAGNSCGGTWIQDVMCPTEDDDDSWCAIVQAVNGKVYEQEFTVDAGKVTFTGTPEEVVRNVEYTPVQAGDVPGHDFHGNQFATGEAALSQKANEASRAADRESRLYGHTDRVENNGEEHHKLAQAAHEKAADLHQQAQIAHTRAAEKAMNAGDMKLAEMHRKAAVEHGRANWAHNVEAQSHKEIAAKFAKVREQQAADKSKPKSLPLEASGQSIVDAPDVFDGFMAMAGGIQTMTLGCGGKAVTVTINVNQAGAQALQAQLETINSNTDQKAFNCFFHEKKAASSWPNKFFWSTGKTGDKPGIYEAAEPSDDGKKAITGKTCRGFSLTFFTDAELTPVPELQGGGYEILPGRRGSPQNPAEIICPEDVSENPTAYLNMGTLTNRPASTKNTPLFASRDDATELPAPVAPAREAGALSIPISSISQPTNMKELNAEALQARNKQLEAKIAELSAQDTAIAKAQLGEAQAELETNKTKLELAAEQKRVKEYQAEEQKRIETQADDAVNQMVEAQQIPALDKELMASWKKDFMANPGLIAKVVKPVGGVASRLTPGATATELQAGRHDISFGFSVPVEMKQLLALTNANARVRVTPGMSKAQMEAAYEEKGKFALQAGLLFKKKLKPNLDEWKDIPPADLARCVGLDASQAMTFNRRAFEAADYLDPNNQFQTLNGTLVLQRTLPLFAYDYPELLAMFTDFSDAPGLFEQTEMSRVVNIPAVMLYNAGLDANGRPIGFVVASPASTVDAPLTLSAYIAVPIVIGQATLSSTQRRLFDEMAPAAMKAIAGYFVGMMTALFTPALYNAYSAVTAPDANGIVKVPTAYATYAKGLADWSMTDLDKMSAIFTQNQVPRNERGILLNPQYYAKLRNDPRLEFFFAAAKGDPQLTQQKLPDGLSGFMPYEAPYLPAANNLAFFAFHKAAVMLKSRLPMDFTQAVTAMIPGSVTTVTEPDSKFSVALVQRVDLVGNYAEYRPEVQLGANKGDGRGGLCGTTQ